MHPENIQQIVDEIDPLIQGRYFGKIFQLATFASAIDFGLRDGRYLFVSCDPASARLYLIKRRVKDLEKQSIPRSPFSQLLVSRLSGAVAINITRDKGERVVRLTFQADDETGTTELWTLIAQLTGRSANLFLLNKDGLITGAARSSNALGQSIGGMYQSPARQPSMQQKESLVSQGHFESISAGLDAHYQKLEEQKSFEVLAKNARSKIRKELQQRLKLKANLEKDLASHGNPDEHKRIGDLLLANITTAKRKNSKTVLKDFYLEGAPEIELQIDKQTSLQDEAGRYFSRYAKAKRAREEIADRLNGITKQLKELSDKQTWLETLIKNHDIESLIKYTEPASRKGSANAKQTAAMKIPGVRVYLSSDGYEVLVGRAARDNDHLTFRVAKPNDVWLHSADYPGSHVVIRRRQQKEIPHRTIVEAAQLAARFSQANKDSKVVVHYAPRKFLSKPKGSAPGLVRMSSFKTILVEPKEVLRRL